MTATTPLPAKLFNHYVIDRVLGQGAMGLVYLARDERDGRVVALKTINEQKANENPMESLDHVRRMQREAELAQKLSHPNIVAFHDVGYENGSIAYLAMEFVDGESLEDRLKREGALPPTVVLQYTTDLASALAHAHGRGIVHRDFKPANILLTKDGHAKLADFGIARPEESTMTVAGQVLGTPAYTSPENVMGGDVTPKTDLFSLGVVVYEMLVGKRPFSGKKMQEILVQLVTQPAPALPMPEWDAFVQRLLKKAPEERFASADAALDELNRSVRPSVAAAPAPVVAEAATPPVVAVQTTPPPPPLPTPPRVVQVIDDDDAVMVAPPKPMPERPVVVPPVVSPAAAPPPPPSKAAPAPVAPPAPAAATPRPAPKPAPPEPAPAPPSFFAKLKKLFGR